VESLRLQINRLTKLVATVESNRIKLEPVEEEVIKSDTDDQAFLVVSRKLQVQMGNKALFDKALKVYLRSVKKEDGLFRTSIKQRQDSNVYFLYEIWETKSSYQTHVTSLPYKEYVKAMLDCLEQPEETSVMPIPASWWEHSNQE